MSASIAKPDQVRDYEVTMFNLTRGQPFSPPVIATHRGRGDVFHLTDPASFGSRRSPRTATTRL